jgi:hypothetical protein
MIKKIASYLSHDLYIQKIYIYLYVYKTTLQACCTNNISGVIY